MKSLDEYLPIVGEKVIADIYQKAYRLINRHIVHINSTAYGGGVAEILNNLVLLMNDVGVDTGWRVLLGSPDFFTVTKKFHNALQGDSINLSNNKKNLYLDTNERFSRFTHLDHDCVIVHDPQPLPLIKFNRKRQPWIWRCHIDITDPNEQVCQFIKPFILRYDMMIISSERFRKNDLHIEQRIIHPSIDPLSPKNMVLSEETISKIFAKFKIPTDKPIIAQVSRFDPWKDPEGVLKVFEIIKEKVDCRLIFCGNMAPDDPEGIPVYNRMCKLGKKHLEKGDVLFILMDNQILVNALQRESAVIIQKSLREGFGLTVAEALWKQTPVVASNVGGIPEQMVDNETGFLVDPEDLDSCAEKIILLLKDEKLRHQMGQNGKENTRKKFLITRHLDDYLKLLHDVLNNH
ncbi:MAG: glycosyltransferase [Candidatus Aminicenantes bacterium]|nr:glycosyltransferase [Candidatus Aminicenantes bacterium]